MNDLDETNLLAHCPRCPYALTGLPVEHRCPECGLQLDRRWQVYGGRLTPRKSARRMRVLVLCAFVVPIAGVLLVLVMALRLPQIRHFLWLELPVLFGLTLGFFMLFSQPRRFVGAGPKGVTVYHKPGRIEHYTWDLVGRASYNVMRKAVVFHTPEREVRISGFYFFRGNVFESDRCVQGINAYPRPHLEQTSTEPLSG